MKLQIKTPEDREKAVKAIRAIADLKEVFENRDPDNKEAFKNLFEKKKMIIDDIEEYDKGIKQ